MEVSMPVACIMFLDQRRSISRDAKHIGGCEVIKNLVIANKSQMSCLGKPRLKYKQI